MASAAAGYVTYISVKFDILHAIIWRVELVFQGLHGG